MGTIRWLIAGSILLFTSFVAWEARAGEYMPVPSARFGSSVGPDYTPQLVSDGTGVLTVWSAGRGAYVPMDRPDLSDILGRRISAEGEPGPSIQMATFATDYGGKPVIARGASGSLLLWSESRSLKGRLLDGTGQPDTATIVLPGRLMQRARYAVGCSADAYLAVWGTDTGGLQGARLSASGQVLEPGAFPITYYTSDLYDLAVAPNGSGWFVAWAAGSGVYVAPIDQAGTVGPPVSLPSSDGADAVSLVQAGEHYVVVFQRSDRVYYACMDANGTVLEPGPAPVSSRPGRQIDPAVAAHGGSALIAWSNTSSGSDEPDTLFTARALEDGSILDAVASVPMGEWGYLNSPRVLWSGDSYFAAFAWGGDILVRRLDEEGHPLGDPSLVTTGADHQTGARIGAAGQGFLLAYSRWSKPGWGVFGVLLDNAGQPSSQPFLIDSTSVYTLVQGVASDGQDYLVLYLRTRLDPEGHNELWAARVRQNGTVLAPFRLPTQNDVYDGAITWNGTDYLAVWFSDSYWNENEQKVCRITRDGLLRDPSGLSFSDVEGQFQPSVAGGGDLALILWQAWVGPGDEPVVATRINAAGQILDTDPIRLSDDYSSEGAVARGTDRFLAVWATHGYGHTEPTRLRGMFVMPDGAVDPHVLEIGSCTSCGSMEYELHPSVAWDGSSFLVAWSDRDSLNGGIQLARIAPDGAISNAGFCTSHPDDERPAVAARADGRCVVAWDRWHFDPYHSSRLVARAGTYEQVTPIYLTGLSASSDGAAVTLSWWALPGAFTRFAVTRSEAGDPEAYTEVGSCTADRDGENRWIDRISASGTYQYRVRGYRVDGEVENLGPVAIVVDLRNGTFTASVLGLPSDRVRLQLSLPSAARTTVKVFDVHGRLIRAIRDLPLLAGPNQVIWDGRTNDGTGAPSGVYWFRAESGNTVVTARGVIVR